MRLQTQVMHWAPPGGAVHTLLYLSDSGVELCITCTDPAAAWTFVYTSSVNMCGNLM